MKKLIYSTIALSFVLFFNCKDTEDELLAPKVYFDKEVLSLEVEDIDNYTYELVSRVSNLESSNVAIEYEIGNQDMIDRYNHRNGTNYQALPLENVNIKNPNVIIKNGETYSNPCQIEIKKLSSIKEGSSFLLPIKIKKASLPTIGASSITFIEVKKTISIKKVYNMNGNYLSVPMPSTANFKSITYETLIYADSFSWISTVLGREGGLMFRFGDTTIKDNQLQIAGAIQFNATLNFQTNKWYHVAFTYDANTRKGSIYINGEKVASKESDIANFDLTRDFFIGYAYDYDPRRIWHGKMSECRVWSVARTENQIKQNMLSVDPNSEGLFAYWKLNGSDFYKEGENYFVRDQSPNHIDAISRYGRYNGGSGQSIQPEVVSLDSRIKL
ncbi:DUF1735 domain-containing protein [Ornithobacterium rhinotracheale]|uniref:DUF1735 and LamG domain-containing protein n=1 Tax=Ornithobacterium rhinotracheale TaxID=28251 RepID=UPI00129C1684|nr:DUF1735 and LamG domain-containing protein [Ornithobacterium rhinotracheale]MRI64635.1 DUF1735 domain-containing protein [Ornithobacterium rhinotracheale]